jgi:hypothetical protein
VGAVKEWFDEEWTNDKGDKTGKMAHIPTYYEVKYNNNNTITLSNKDLGYKHTLDMNSFLVFVGSK